MNWKVEPSFPVVRFWIELPLPIGNFARAASPQSYASSLKQISPDLIDPHIRFASVVSGCNRPGLLVLHAGVRAGALSHRILGLARGENTGKWLRS